MSTWRDTLKGLVWPTSAPVALSDMATLRVSAQNGLALKGMGWTLPEVWGGGSIQLTEGRSATYAQMYARQPWVYAVVNKLVRGIGRLPLKGYGRDGDDRKRLTTGPLAGLLDAPFERGSPTTLKQRIVGDLAIYGNALLVIGRDRPDQAAAFLQPMHPQGWTIADDGTYRIRPVGELEKVFQPWEIVHLKFYRPGDDLGWGLSPLEPLRQALLTEDFAQRLAAFTFENGGQPGLSLETEKDMKPEGIAAIRGQFEGRHVGGSNAGRPLILTGGLKANPWDNNLEDVALVEHRKLTREEVCAAYDVPPVLVGILDRATFSNIEELHLSLYMDTLGPWLTLIEETIQTQLLAGVPTYRGQFIEFSLEEVLKGNIQARYDAINKAVGGSWMTRAEARRLENLRDLKDPEYDRLLAPLNMSTEAAAAKPAGVVAEAPPGEAAKGYMATGRKVGPGAERTQAEYDGRTEEG